MGPSVIGSDLVIMGNLESKGEVTVEGQIQGDIHCAMLLVGENAQVTGGIIADEVVVRGRVLGSLRGNKVTLQSSAHVEGDIFHRALAIEQGAFFEGKSRRSDDPLSTTPRGEAAPLGDILANGSVGGIRN
jgi:cytoskeletal protein CcmA (bactofilin family)